MTLLIEFEFSGGYTNLTKRYIVNTKNLSEDLAKELNNIIIETKIFELKQDNIIENPQVRDAVNYKLKLQDEEKSLALNFDDISMPKKIRPFIQKLRKMALSVQPKLNTRASKNG